MIVPVAMAALADSTLAADRLTVIDAPFTQWTRTPFIQGTTSASDLRAIALDEKNRVYVGSPAGLFRVDRDHVTPVSQETLSGPVLCLHGHPITGIWIGAWNGVFRLRDDKAVRLGAIDGPITAIGPGGSGMVVANPTGLHRWNDDQNKWIKIDAHVPTSVRRILPGLRGVYELLATDLGFYECDGPKVERKEFPEPFQLSSNARDVVLFSHDRPSPLSGVWYASNDGLVNVPILLPRFPERSPQVWRAQPASTTPASSQALPSADIRRLLGVKGRSVPEDALWVGTGAGVVRLMANQSPSLFHSQRWLPSDDVRDMVASPDRSLWIATAGGIAHLVPETMTLEDKARFFEQMIQDRHIRPPGLVERCQLTRPGDVSSFQPADTDNDGEYTGTYLVAQAFRYAATASAEAKSRAVAAFEAMAFLESVTGQDGFIARTVVPSTWTEMADPNRSHSPQEVAQMRADNTREKIVERRWRLSEDLAWLWKGDTSSDEVTGHLYAYDIFAEFVANPEEKKRVSALVARIVDRIMRDGFVLKDEDGEATLWGVWSPAKLNGDPNWLHERGVNSVEILSYLTTAHWLTGDPKYDAAIETLLNDHHYAENILEPRPREPGAYTYIDDELLAMAYWGLIRHETKPRRLEIYGRSLDRWFSSVMKDASPLYNFTYAVLTQAQPNAFVQERCVDLLRDVPLDMIHWSIDNRQRLDVMLVHRPQAQAIQTDRLLPPSEIPVLRWDNNPYVAAGGEGGMAEMCPAFWLWPYWMGRWQRIIGEVTR
jgi:hypothetical protein